MIVDDGVGRSEADESVMTAIANDMTNAATTERGEGAAGIAGGGTPALIEVEHLYKTYDLGRVAVPVLRGVSMTVREGEFLAVLGASGSGKSTLLHLIGGLDRPDKMRGSRGTCRRCGRSIVDVEASQCPDCESMIGAKRAASIRFRGGEVTGFSGRELDRYRRSAAGFVFQFYHLLTELTVAENVSIARMIKGTREDSAMRAARSEELLKQVGLGHRLRHRPAELSGGERQRVAIARALINEPALLLADEPTGNLDHVTGQKILDMLGEVRAARRQTMIVVTHDVETAKRADRVVRLVDGRVAE